MHASSRVLQEGQARLSPAPASEADALLGRRRRGAELPIKGATDLTKVKTGDEGVCLDEPRG